jgi:outer membrane protein
VPIFTGGLTSSRIRAAAERNNADRISVETARRAALQQTTQAWSQTLAARAGVTSNDAQVRATRIAAEGTREEQRVGLRTTLDVLNAEQEYRNAQLALVGAQRDEYVAAAALLAAAGQLDARYFAPVTPYDPAANTRKVSRAFGWVPWEPLIEAVDSIGVPQTTEKPLTTTAPMATAPPASAQ